MIGPRHLRLARPARPPAQKGWNQQQHALRVQRMLICLHPQPCACEPDEDVSRLVEEGMPQEDAVGLVQGRKHWLELEEMGDPHKPGEMHYLLFPPGDPRGLDVVADMTWRPAERGSRHPAAEQFDPLWLRRFQRTRGLR